MKQYFAGMKMEKLGQLHDGLGNCFNTLHSFEMLSPKWTNNTVFRFGKLSKPCHIARIILTQFNQKNFGGWPELFKNEMSYTKRCVDAFGCGLCLDLSLDYMLGNFFG